MNATIPTSLQLPRPLQAIAGFAELLRAHGLNVGIAEQQAFVQAALAIPIERNRQLNAAWRAIACHCARDWRRWPELFDRYWHPDRLTGQVRVSGQTRPSRDLRQAVQALKESLGGAEPREAQTMGDSAVDSQMGGQDEPVSPRAQGGASRTDALHDRSLSEWLPQDLEQLGHLADRIANRLRLRLTRRWQQHERGCQLDMRRTIRASLRTGGDLALPVWRQARRERPKVFILVDVSRSMQTHAQLFLRIARAFVGAAHARVFVFHTRLAEVTALLQRDSAAVQEKVNVVTAGFTGGTRIATSVGDFHRTHARAQLGRRARVWIFSDGFDADEPGMLQAELARVRQRGAQITWFHPTVQRPAAVALHQCNPLIDRFVALSTLRDLANAAAVLT